MRRATLPLLACLASGCLLDVDAPDFSILTDFQFATSGEAWEPGVVDYPAADEAAVGFLGDRRARPAESGATDLALYLRGDNVSNDLFMYWSRRYTGLFPEQTYSVTIDLEYLSNASRDCTTGPGPVTWLKLGLTGVEPLRFLDQDSWYRLSLDKGQQGQGSATTVVLATSATTARAARPAHPILPGRGRRCPRPWWSGPAPREPSGSSWARNRGLPAPTTST